MTSEGCYLNFSGVMCRTRISSIDSVGIVFVFLNPSGVLISFIFLSLIKLCWLSKYGDCYKTYLCLLSRFLEVNALLGKHYS